MSSPTKNKITDLSMGSIDQIFLVTGADVHETKNGDPYLRATLGDSTGEIPAIQWETDHAPEPGLYRVQGMVESYKGNLQCKISSMTPAQGDVSEYTPSSPIHVAHLQNQLEQSIEDIGGEYGQVVRDIFADNDLMDAFLIAPAATKNHHAYRFGLAEHTVSMAHIAMSIASHYERMYGQDAVDEDLLLAGTLLHDLGKIYELEEDDLEWKRKSRGELVGHMAEVVALIHDSCLATLASQDTRDRLMHMVLSHHGRNEWGSPVEPKLLEAQILHCVDLMDSRFNIFRSACEGLGDGEVSERIWALGGRVVR